MSEIVENSGETGPKRRAGRPSEGRRRREIMASDAEWQAWLSIASDEGTSVSDIVRRLMNDYAADRPKQTGNDT